MIWTVVVLDRLSLVIIFSKWCFWSPGSRPPNAFNLVYLLKKTSTSAKNIKNTLTVHQPGFRDDEMIKLKAAALILIYFSVLIMYLTISNEIMNFVFEKDSLSQPVKFSFLLLVCLICFHKQIWISAATKAIFSVICMFKKEKKKVSEVGKFWGQCIKFLLLDQESKISICMVHYHVRWRTVTRFPWNMKLNKNAQRISCYWPCWLISAAIITDAGPVFIWCISSILS